MFAKAKTRRTEKGKHYGELTDKFIRVLTALLWVFHNSASGRCFPSYERIMERADCARSTVYEAIIALERAGILTWMNRLVRVREPGALGPVDIHRSQIMAPTRNSMDANESAVFS
jgi:DNA-binding FadR family transcriptional regulator